MSGSRQIRVCGSACRGAPLELCPTDRDPSAPANPAASDSDELEAEELELDDPVIDEAALPELDVEDAEVPLRDPGYDDLIDRGWLERGPEDEWDEDGAAGDDVGLTIELDGPTDDEDGAQVVDLDVGSLLTSLPSEGTELDIEAGPREERGDGSLGIGALRDVLLPNDDEDEHDDREVGIDERFPVFDDDAERTPRPSADDESEIGPEDLS